MDCSLPGSSVHGILQTRILEWVAISSSGGSSQPRDWTHVSYVPALAGGFFTTGTTWEVQVLVLFVPCIIEPRQTHLFGIVSSSVSQLRLLSTYWMQRNMPLKLLHHFLQSGKSLFKDKHKPIYCRRRYLAKAEDWEDWSQGQLMEGCSQWVVQKSKLRFISNLPQASIVVGICRCWLLSR